MTETLRAFHGDPAIKAKYVSRVEAHRAADRLIHGVYWEDGKGCAVGCTIEGSEHARYETELGIPRVLARLEDRLFEGMENGNAQVWPGRFLEAIPVGADLSRVWPQFAVWLLVDETDGVLRFAKTERSRAAIQHVAGLYGRVVAGETIAEGDWRAAAYAAYAADAAAAAYAAAYAAYAAAYAAYAAAAYAAAAAAADAADAARRRHYVTMSEKLLGLLRAANA